MGRRLVSDTVAILMASLLNLICMMSQFAAICLVALHSLLNANMTLFGCFKFQLRSNESGYSSEGLGDCLNITRLRPEGSPMSIDSQNSLPGTRSDFYPGEQGDTL